MDKNQAKHYLLSFSEENFIKWHNARIIDPFGDYSFATIKDNTTESFWEMAKNFLPSDFLALAAKGRYFDDERYFCVADRLISFDSIEVFLETTEGESAIDYFLQNEEEERKYLEALR